MAPKIVNIRVVAQAVQPDGSSTLVDCAVRPSDLDTDVLIYLQEKASGMHGDLEEPLHDEFDHSDAVGG